MDFKKLFDTEDPNNNLGPIVVAIIATAVVFILGGMFSLVRH